MAETMTLKVDTGAVLIQVENEHGETMGQFEFNPVDSNLLKRYDNAVDFFNSISFASNLTEEQKFEEVNKLSDEIGKQFDYLLGYKVSEELFSGCGPLTIIKNGDFFFENVLEGIGGIIEKATQQRLNKKLEKIRNATAKYSQ